MCRRQRMVLSFSMPMMSIAPLKVKSAMRVWPHISSTWEKKTDYVTLVDCGDALQGDTIGTISQGAYLVEIMNRVGYDFAVLGNPEFDYGMDRLSELLELADAQYLGCNIRHIGSEESIASHPAPYKIVAYGDTRVAFLGISTPESIVKSTPACFMDETGRLSTAFMGIAARNCMRRSRTQWISAARKGRTM